MESVMFSPYLAETLSNFYINRIQLAELSELLEMQDGEISVVELYNYLMKSENGMALDNYSRDAIPSELEDKLSAIVGLLKTAYNFKKKEKDD